MRTTARLARRSACAAALAVLAAGVASAPALAAGTGAATLAAADSTGFDGFGQSAALSGNGDVAVAGSPDHGASGAGAAYVFTDDGQGFTQSAELTPPGTDSSELLGTSAAISADGQTVVAGAPGDGNDTGAAFVFTDQSGAWTQTAKLVGAGASVNDQEGDSVAMSADASTIVVTAPFSNGEGGAAYVFTKSGSTYAEVQKLTTARQAARSGNRRRPTAADLLGFSAAVSSDGSTIVLGAPGTNGSAGTADVFTRSGSTWTQTAQLAGANTSTLDSFGLSVAVSGSGTTVAAGSPWSNGGDGSAYVFTESGGTFTQASQVLPPAGTSEASPARRSACRPTAPP